MRGLLIILAAGGWLVWRWGRRLKPLATKVLSWGDDLGGLTMFFAFGGAAAASRAVTRGARWMLWAAFAVAAMLNGAVRLAFIVAIGVALWRRTKGRRAEAADFRRSGFATRTERKLIHEATTQTALAMGLGREGRAGQPAIAPTFTSWRKLPVTVGGKPVDGQWRYQCKASPAPGKDLASITSKVGRGIGGEIDPLRDAIANTLAAARGREAAQLRRQGLVPRIVMTSAVKMTNRSGEPTGKVQLTLWTTDPFRRQVDFPHDPTKPIVRRFADPAPVGVLRSNVEYRMKLNKSTGVQGGNGSGKSSVIRPALLAAAHTDVTIICIALKGPRDYAQMRARFAGGVIITDPKTAANVIRWVEREVRRRNNLETDELAAERDLVVIIDEAQELRDDISLVIPAAKLGRSARVWLWVVTQYAPASVSAADGGFPTTLARELGQRLAGRIEGSHQSAVVAVGERANAQAGPHLIPPGERWQGVLFGDDGQYLRAYWTNPEDPNGHLARCAASLGPRPDDPEGFIDALEQAGKATAAPTVTEYDGASRGVDGVARALNLADLPPDVLDALKILGLQGRANQKTVGADRIRTHISTVPPTSDDELIASTVLEAFLAAPRTPTPSPVTHESE